MYEDEDDKTIKKFDINEECHFEWLYQKFCTSEHIKHDNNSIKNRIKKSNEIFLWKEFNSSIPVSIEYNINF